MKSGLLSIGEFSKLTRASIKSLRYYERIGVLKPAYVDPDTHYRYFAVPQIFRVSLIRMCVEEGLPLEELDRFLEDEDILKAGEFFNRISELANRRWWQSYETMLRMYAYQKEYEHQILLKTETLKEYSSDEEEDLLIIPLGVPIRDFSYAQYSSKVSELFRYAHEHKLITLAQQGVYHSDDDQWFVYMQVFDDTYLESKLSHTSEIRLIRPEPRTYRVLNVYEVGLDACFKKAINSAVQGYVRYISDGWAYSLVTGIYTVNVLYI